MEKRRLMLNTEVVHSAPACGNRLMIVSINNVTKKMYRTGSARHSKPEETSRGSIRASRRCPTLFLLAEMQREIDEDGLRWRLQRPAVVVGVLVELEARQ